MHILYGWGMKIRFIAHLGGESMFWAWTTTGPFSLKMTS